MDLVLDLQRWCVNINTLFVILVKTIFQCTASGNRLLTIGIFDYCFISQGNRAIAEIQFADYIYPAFDQACILHPANLSHIIIIIVWLTEFLMVRLSMKPPSSDIEVGINSIVVVSTI